MSDVPQPTDPGRDAPDATDPGARVEIRAIQRHTDPRGAVFEPIGDPELARQRNAHVVITEPGQVRGNHLHRLGTEILAVQGPARVRYRDAGGLRDVEVPSGEVLSFTVPPGVPHAVLNTGREPNLLIAFRDRPHDPADPDLERVVLLETAAG